MAHVTQLKDILRTYLPWHGARLNFWAMFLIALFKVKTVNLAEIATALNPKAQTGSNHRRLQHFFADFEVDYEVIAKLVAALVPQQVQATSYVWIERTGNSASMLSTCWFWLSYTRGLPFPFTGYF